MTTQERIDAIRARAEDMSAEPDPAPDDLTPRNKAEFIRGWLARDPHALSTDIAKAWAEHSDREILPQEVTQARRRLGIATPPPPPNAQAERNRGLVMLRRTGMSFAELADTYGLSRSRCQQIVRAAEGKQ